MSEVNNKIDKALGIVNDLCQGTIKWRMSVPAQPDSDPDIVIADALNTAKQENARLRELLWFNHGHPDTAPLYGDDGERQCAACMIDFVRDPAEEIERKIIEYNKRKYLKESP